MKSLHNQSQLVDRFRNAMEENTSIQCHNITKRFGERTLFESLDFAVAQRERVALLGASGAGKSTLLHCLSGVTPIDSGEIRLAGKDLSLLNEQELANCRRKSIGTVFQFFHLLPTFNVFENVELPLQLIGKSRDERRPRVQGLLKRMGIESRSNAYPSELSGGEMQRVAIARAIAHKPSILFADEPTGNLDRKSGAVVLNLLQEITEEEGASLLMVTHSGDAASICQRRFELVDGGLEAC